MGEKAGRLVELVHFPHEARAFTAQALVLRGTSLYSVLVHALHKIAIPSYIDTSTKYLELSRDARLSSLVIATPKVEFIILFWLE